MRVLGLDAGSVVTGYGCILAEPNAQPRYLEAGVLKAPKDWSVYGRLGMLLKDMDTLLDDLRPDVVAIEAGYVPPDAARGADALVLAGARAVCGAVAAKRGLSVSEYAPATIKKCACGSGRATKEQVRAIVMLRLKIAKEPDLNASDAIAVALTHYQMAVGRPFPAAPGRRETT